MPKKTALPNVQASYERLLNHLPGVAYRCSIKDNYKYILTFASQGCQKLLELKPEDIMNENTNVIEQMMPNEDKVLVREKMRDSIVAGTLYQIMYRVVLPSGQLKWIWDQGEATYDEDGTPLTLEGIMMDVSKYKISEQNLKAENHNLKISASSSCGLGELVGKSEPMRQVYDFILKTAKNNTNIIIYGETGTGKDVVARALHTYSGCKGAYVAVNCGAIPEQLMESEFFGHMRGSFSGAHANKEGYIAAANNGTLFLDEIGELPMHLQVKLLRALENKTYTPVGGTVAKTSRFRLVAATNQDLVKMVDEKKMRSDFYYRINVLSVTLPPLRQRHGDIPLLSEAYYHRKKIKITLPAHVHLTMEHYGWPGNVRELNNFLDRYAALGDEALQNICTTQSHENPFPLIRRSMTLEEATLKLEERMIKQALHDNHWHRGKTAEALGINLRTLQRKMKRLQFEGVE